MAFFIIIPAILLVAASLLPCFATAQPVDLIRSRYAPAAAYNYAESGDVTIIVNVWGTVRYPGLYEVPVGTTVSTLFSLAGGPQVTVRRKSVKRQVSARLTRGESADQAMVLDAFMENDVLALGEDPVLQDGDVLTVNTVERQRISWRDLFPVIAAVASVALAVERISGS